MLSPYGRREVGLIGLVGGLATIVVAYYLPLWALVPALLTLLLLAFFRDPPRRIPSEPNVLVSPADGWVVEIHRGETSRAPERKRGEGAKTDDDVPDPSPALGALNTERGTLRIVIFLTVFDVHVNRSPCAGRVVEIHQRPGRFLNAMKPESTHENQATELVIEPRPPVPGPVCVRQIVGGLARRIVCAAVVGDELATGQRFGMIKFGSRTELLVPDDPRWEVAVRVGQHVKGGSSVVARLIDR